MLGEAIGLHLLESALYRVFGRGYWRVRFWRCAMVNPSEDIRVAFSAVVRISQGDSYVLVRNLHRPETFSPLGGVYKYKSRSHLDHLDFKPQIIGPTDDMEDDIRGFLPRKNLPSLVSWFKDAKEREAADDCLTRELSEETAEAHLPRHLKCPELIHFRLIRAVQEGPESVPGQPYEQYRIFEVYEADISKPSAKAFFDQILKYARQGGSELLLVSARDIQNGATAAGHLISPNASYLIGKQRIWKESRPLSAATRG